MADENFIFQKFPPEDQSIYAAAFTYRWDLMQEMTNQTILFVISVIPGRSRRSIELSGTTIANSSAEITVQGYTNKPLEIFRNGITNLFFSPTVTMPVRGILLGNPPTNIILVGNVTNYPIEQNGKWQHLRQGIY